MRLSLFFLVSLAAVGCGGPLEPVPADEGPQLETAGQELSLSNYSAFNTNSALDPNTSADSPVSLAAGETVMIGTCLLNGSAFTGDTYLRLYNPAAFQVAFNDDSAANGCVWGSKLAYTAPAAGIYNIRAGCYSSGACTGTVAISRSKGVYAFNVSNTSNATINTFNRQFSANAGDVIRVSTCAVNSQGASASGDTYLRLYTGGGVHVGSSNDAVGCGLGSEIVYTVPSSGFYQLRAGGLNNTTCSGTVTVYAE